MFFFFSLLCPANEEGLIAGSCRGAESKAEQKLSAARRIVSWEAAIGSIAMGEASRCRLATGTSDDHGPSRNKFVRLLDRPERRAIRYSRLLQHGSAQVRLAQPSSGPRDGGWWDSVAMDWTRRWWCELRGGLHGFLGLDANFYWVAGPLGLWIALGALEPPWSWLTYSAPALWDGSTDTCIIWTIHIYTQNCCSVAITCPPMQCISSNS